MRRRSDDPFSWDEGQDWDLQEFHLALEEGGCPACALAAETEWAALLWLREANINDPDTVERVTTRGGLCARHWDALLSAHGDDPGVGPGDLLVATARHEGIERQAGTRCPVCTAMHDRAWAVIGLIVERLDHPGFRDDFGRSFGLCGRHNADAVAAGTHQAAALLAGIFRTQTARLAGALEAGLRDPSVRGKAARELAEKLAGRVGSISRHPTRGAGA